MSIHDYLIEQAGKDWSSWLSGWVPPLPSAFTIWLVNSFGDIFIVMEDGSVHMLDVGSCTLVKLAEDREHFTNLLDDMDNANDWLLIPLVDRCIEAGVTLGANQCYAFKIPPLLGGKYDFDNVYRTDLSVHYGFLADLHKGTQDLPDGTPIRLVIQ
jgi:hypothetical protein